MDWPDALDALALKYPFLLPGLLLLLLAHLHLHAGLPRRVFSRRSKSAHLQGHGVQHFGDAVDDGAHDLGCFRFGERVELRSEFSQEGSECDGVLELHVELRHFGYRRLFRLDRIGRRRCVLQDELFVQANRLRRRALLLANRIETVVVVGSCHVGRTL